MLEQGKTMSSSDISCSLVKDFSPKMAPFWCQVPFAAGAVAPEMEGDALGLTVGTLLVENCLSGTFVGSTSSTPEDLGLLCKGVMLPDERLALQREVARCLATSFILFKDGDRPGESASSATSL